MRTSLSVILPFLFPIAALAASQKCTTEDIAGLYESQYGQVQCSADKDKLDCCYGNLKLCDKKLFLNLLSDNKELQGYWEYADGSTGAAKFIVNKECSLEEGYRGWGDTATSAWKVGNKIKNASAKPNTGKVTPSTDIDKSVPEKKMPGNSARHHEQDAYTTASSDSKTSAITAPLPRCRDAASCVKLGDKYLNGSGVKKNAEIAIELYERACGLDSTEGCYNAGILYQQATDIPQDLMAAADFYNLACTLGHGLSCFKLGSLYATGQGVNKDVNLALMLFRQACDGSYAKGCFNVGNSYFRGFAVTKDEKQALVYFKKACTLGSDQGCANLKNLQASAEKGSGRMTKRNQDKNQEITGLDTKMQEQDKEISAPEKQSQKLNIADGQTALAGVKEGIAAYKAGDYTTAHAKFLEPAKAGNADAQSILGTMYALGKGVTKDMSVANSWFREAADQGHAESQFKLGMSYLYGKVLPKNELEAETLFREAANQGHTGAQYRLAAIHKNRYLATKDISELKAARNLYALAAQNGHKKAGEILPKIVRTEKAFYEVAFVKGSEAYRAGDYALALKKFSEVAETGQARAQHNLGVMHQNGYGVRKDLKLATKWYEKAASQGFTNSQIALGQIHYKRYSEKKDSSKTAALVELRAALSWYEKAANAGHEKAAELVAAIKPVESNLQQLIAIDEQLASDNARSQAIKKRKTELTAEKCENTYKVLTLSQMIGPDELNREEILEYIEDVKSACGSSLMAAGVSAHFLKRNHTEAAKKFSKACGLGDPAGCHFAATLAAFGDNPMMKPGKGLSLLKQYCSRGQQLSCRVVEYANDR